MEIAKRKYSVKSSSFWIVTPDFHLTLHVWTDQPQTYFFGEPIFIEDSRKLLDKNELGFPNPNIDLMDSTLLENNVDHHFKDLKIEFNSSNLFHISSVKINGLTRENEKLTINTKTQFNGFEIWKIGDYTNLQSDFEKWLIAAGYEYEVRDDTENGILYLEIKNRG